MRKSTILLSVFVFVILVASPVFAEDSTATPTSIQKRFNIRNEIRNEIKNEIKEVREENREQKRNILDSLKDKIGTIKDTVAKIISGEVTVNSGSSLTVVKDGKTYNINVTANTIFKRHFWGNSSMSEIAVGDKVNIWGKYTDDTKTTIEARMIRDTSIMKRFGTFIGTIKAIDGSTYTLETTQRGTQMVTISSDTKLVNRKEVTIIASDIQVGHKIRVKGMWNKTNNTITQITHLKDFSLPVVLSPTSTQ